MDSPTQRSLRHLRKDGWTVAIVEHFNNFTKTRSDLFGFADLLAMKPGCKPLLVQVTASGWAARLAKIRDSPEARTALASGFDIEVHGWRRLVANRNRMTIIVIPVTQEDTKWTVPIISEAQTPELF